MPPFLPHWPFLFPLIEAQLEYLLVLEFFSPIRVALWVQDS